MANNVMPGMVVTYVRSIGEHVSATITSPSRHGDNYIHLKYMRNGRRLSTMLLLIKCSSSFATPHHPHLKAPPHVCCHVCHAHAWPCLSTGWALNCHFDLTFGTAAMLAQGGGGATCARKGGGGTSTRLHVYPAIINCQEHQKSQFLKGRGGLLTSPGMRKFSLQ